MASEQELAEDARHAAKMAKKKAVRDRMMAEKSGEKGLIIVHTGAGKGKSSAAFGMIVRCVAHGFPCAVVQFIKGAWDTGERRIFIEHFGDLCQFHAMGGGFTWETQDRARDIAAAQAGWEKAKELIADPDLHMVVLDPFALQMGRQPMPSSRAAFFLVLTGARGRAGRQIVFVLFCGGFRRGEFGRVEPDNVEFLRE